jgi:two-component system nitrogen regulation sensor histidine kinase NtrY
MVFNDFRFRAGLRVILLAISMAITIYSMLKPETVIAGILFGVIVIIQLTELFRFITKTNRNLTRFLDLMPTIN